MPDQYITHPGVGRTFHIFTDEHRSLCGRYMMFRRNPDACEPVKGDETWVDGQDCKACFRKAGLLFNRPDGEGGDRGHDHA